MELHKVKTYTAADTESIEVALSRIGFEWCAFCSVAAPRDAMQDTGNNGPGFVCIECVEIESARFG